MFFKRMYESIRADNIEFEAVFEKINKPKFIELLNICKNKFINLSETNCLILLFLTVIYELVLMVFLV